MMIPVFERGENIFGKGENAECQHASMPAFYLVAKCFQKPYLSLLL